MRLMKCGKLAITISIVSTTLAAMAAPPLIVTQGNGAAIACASCHGVDGAGNAQAGFPALAQLPEPYILKQIANFKSAARTNPVMMPIAKAISAEDATSAAQYYAHLPRPKLKPATAGVTSPVSNTTATDSALLVRGKLLATNGDWDHQVPACFKCHAIHGVGVPPVFPPIIGQPVAYTVAQLQAWKTGARTNDPQKLMTTVAQNLTDDQIQAVATYLATLEFQGEKK